jgi:parallel beta-helix repeat protein
MDSGKRGCNDNVLRENDFSYAPTNGIEVTFSRNIIAGNRVFECDHGILGRL